MIILEPIHKPSLVREKITKHKSEFRAQRPRNKGDHEDLTHKQRALLLSF